jgi:hypothetical protein
MRSIGYPQMQGGEYEDDQEIRGEYPPFSLWKVFNYNSPEHNVRRSANVETRATC